jgi:hypothetical protein
MGWGTRILTISLLFTIILVSGCATNFGSNTLDFGSSAEAKQLQASFCQTYGDPATYNGPPRFVAAVSSSVIKDNIPSDKVTKFSTDTDNIYFWVVYQNFPQGEDLNLSWIYQDNVVTAITKKTDRRSGIALSQFVRPKNGWPTGTHTIRIEGKRNNTQIMFEIANGPTESRPFSFSSPETIPTPTPIPNMDYSIMGGVSNDVLSCSAPDNALTFTGSTGSAVPSGTVIQLKVFNKTGSGTQDLPTDGILIGSTNTRNDGSWEYSWDGKVPGYVLKNGQEYAVKYLLPSGKYTIVKFTYQCAGTDDIDYSIMGGVSNDVLSCSAPDNSLTFTGSTGSAVPSETVIQLKVFNKPGSGIQDLPAEGILIGSTNTRNDGSWEYSWDGNVPGYSLTKGQEYGVKCILPSGKYTLVGFVYQCAGSTSDTASSDQRFTPIGSTMKVIVPQKPQNIPVISSPQVNQVVTDTNSFSSVVNSLDTPAKAAQYTQAHYTFVWHDGCVSYPPEEFFRLEQGDCKDVATFLSYIIA